MVPTPTDPNRVLEDESELHLFANQPLQPPVEEVFDTSPLNDKN